MRTRESRRKLTSNVIKRRLEDVKQNDPKRYDIIKKEAHRLSKQHPFDCGNPKCGICHCEKVMGKPSWRDKKEQEKCKEEMGGTRSELLG